VWFCNFLYLKAMFLSLPVRSFRLKLNVCNYHVGRLVSLPCLIFLLTLTLMLPSLAVFGQGLMNLGISGVKVYPNPVNDFLTIELFSAEGKLVLSKTEATSTMRIDMQGFASGVYTLKVVGMENAIQVVR